MTTADEHMLNLIAGWVLADSRARAEGRCCSMHGEPACCDPEDCGPCCEDCPSCPTLVRIRARRPQLTAGVTA